ncbi:hypothetical protein Pan110_07010 [Gimesia panareensis]|nr:hypothetical protein Pan110_07010 [Gimesia panareensis]
MDKTGTKTGHNLATLGQNFVLTPMCPSAKSEQSIDTPECNSRVGATLCGRPPNSDRINVP